jgi:hypothetical protein
MAISRISNEKTGGRMNYYIKRDLQEFGPYSLADLQRYVGTGNILVTDLTRGEGMTEWMPVSSVIGTIPVPSAPRPHGYEPFPEQYPLPPGLRWAAVLLLSVVTCGLFVWIWFFVQASFIRKLVPENLAIIWAIFGLAFSMGGAVATVALGRGHMGHGAPMTVLFRLAGTIFWITANFSLRNAIEEHYNSAENIGLSLSGVMTFFFNVIYFQYHFDKIRAARLQQGAFVGRV